jgi:hypothetical protein
MVKNSSGLSITIGSSIRKLSIVFALLTGFVSPCMAEGKPKVEITGSPSIQDDRITLKVKVKDASDRPMVGLKSSNFGLVVDKNELKFEPKDWKSPEETTPPPVWIVVLIDLSGSMGAKDASGTTKLEGALNAIRQFNKSIAERSRLLPDDLKPRIAIVPFGEPGTDCAGFTLDRDTLDNFFPVGDFKLTNQLDFLATIKPCASTNLYSPLSKALQMLGDKQDVRFNPTSESNLPKPKLSIIMLSDGFHTKPKEAEDFKELQSLLQSQPEITVHTLGYGLTLQELGEKYKLKRPATREDINKKKVSAEEFVDEKRLAEIAKSGGGISEFSADADKVTEKLQVFLNAILGEYEISYVQPTSERGSKHNVQVSVTIDKNKSESNLEPYTITVFGRSLPRSTRIIIIGSTILLIGIGGILPFSIWAKRLKEEAIG